MLHNLVMSKGCGVTQWNEITVVCWHMKWKGENWIWLPFLNPHNFFIISVDSYRSLLSSRLSFKYYVLIFHGIKSIYIVNYFSGKLSWHYFLDVVWSLYQYDITLWTYLCIYKVIVSPLILFFKGDKKM